MATVTIGSATVEAKECTGCGKLVPVYADQPCWECVAARAATVMRHGRCACKPRDRRERTVRTRSRSWVACDRCLGVVRQLG